MKSRKERKSQKERGRVEGSSFKFKHFNNKTLQVLTNKEQIRKWDLNVYCHFVSHSLCDVLMLLSLVHPSILSPSSSCCCFFLLPGAMRPTWGRGLSTTLTTTGSWSTRSLRPSAASPKRCWTSSRSCTMSVTGRTCRSTLRSCRAKRSRSLNWWVETGFTVWL